MMANLTIHKTKCYTGLLWLVEAGRLLIKSPIKWAIMAICLVAMILVAYFAWNFLAERFFQPSSEMRVFVGLFFAWIWGFLLLGGLLVSAQSLDKKGHFFIYQLFAGIYSQFRDLVMSSIYSFFITMTVFLLFGITINMVLKILVIVLVILGFDSIERYDPYFTFLLMVFMLMPFTIMWFTPALVVFADKKPWRAIYDSLRIFMRRFLTLSLFWLSVGYLLLIMVDWKWVEPWIYHASYTTLALSGLAVGVGVIFLVLVVYVSYRQIIGEPSEVLVDSKQAA